MTDFSFNEDILDSRDLDKRLEELASMRKPWLVGKNMPGFMPDNEPSALDSWHDARVALIHEMESYLEDLRDDADAAPRLEQLNDDARAAIKRLDLLKEPEEFGETIGAYHFWMNGAAENDGFDDEDDADEYKTLCKMRDASGREWDGGITFIRDSHFEDYAEELAESIGLIERGAQWPCNHIDWEAAAEALKQDYSQLEVDGTTYYYRS